MNLQTLAGLLKAEFRGPADYKIEGMSDIERLPPEAGLEDHRVYFVETPAVFKRHPKAVEKGAVLTTTALAHHFPRALVVPEGQARIALIAMLKHFDRAPVFAAGVSAQALVHPKAVVDASASVLPGAVVMEGAVIGPRCVIHPGAVVEPFAEIGADTVLRANAVIGHHCVIGRHCLIHSSTVIGADGFGFFDTATGRHKVPHIGNVVIADHVEIGASATVDRATIESTRIGEHTKFDDQVHVGHNCQIGRYIYIVGNSAIGGSVVMGDGSMISGMTIVKDHLNIAPGTIVMGHSAVAQDTEPKTAYFGTPARPARQMHKMHAALERLPELIAKVRELEEKLASRQPV
jgi:UDP-3-O-[3-hydroxymyristoyl] glucosamine N-acyltransferase